MLDFNTQIRTNLNILYVGSSVGHQFAQAFEEASTPVERQVTRFASNKRGWYQENVVSSLTPYNGTISCLRITGLFLKNRMDKVRLVGRGGGWLSSDVRQLKQLAHQWRNVKSTNKAKGIIPTACERDHGADDKNNAAPVQLNGTRIDNQQECEEKNFDVVVYQPPVCMAPKFCHVNPKTLRIKPLMLYDFFLFLIVSLSLKRSNGFIICESTKHSHGRLSTKL